MNDMLSNSGILSAYRARTPGSEALAREAATLFPSGITHDSRHLEPYGVYVARASGPHKWDVDGNGMSISTAATARCCWDTGTRP